MGIVIHRVNDSANEELKAPYDEASLLAPAVLTSDNAPDGDPRHKLVVLREAAEEILAFIGWGTGDDPATRVEQGGILLGKRCHDEDMDVHFAVVSKAITADGARGSAGFLDMTPECWLDMHARKDAYNAAGGERAVIVGWFHTHPNGLSCFMSGTDRNTQDMFFSGEHTYSLVMNPQRRLLKAFRAGACHAAQAFLVTSPEKPAEAR